ncbi:hypothetical protein ACFORG_07250 [Lutimaribacter marinistellae]|uniref:Uncharacterized protein n=1 Tax=Lutimaribacter marinistellae TaxID=1820329 RepID=A0ABV7TFQ5_9RHOB
MAEKFAERVYQPSDEGGAVGPDENEVSVFQAGDAWLKLVADYTFVREKIIGVSDERHVSSLNKRHIRNDIFYVTEKMVRQKLLQIASEASMRKVI